MLSKSRGLARRNVVRPFEAALAPETNHTSQPRCLIINPHPPRLSTSNTIFLNYTTDTRTDKTPKKFGFHQGGTYMAPQTRSKTQTLQQVLTSPTFHHFPRLPVELRLIIWSYATTVLPSPRRVVTLQIDGKYIPAAAAVAEDDNSSENTQIQIQAQAHAQVEEKIWTQFWTPHVFSSVSHEARQVWLGRGASCLRWHEGYEKGAGASADLEMEECARGTTKTFKLRCPRYDFVAPAVFEPEIDVLFVDYFGRNRCVVEAMERWLTREVIGQVRYLAIWQSSFQALSAILEHAWEYDMGMPGLSFGVDFLSLEELFIIIDERGVSDAELEREIEKTADWMARMVSRVPEFRVKRWRLVREKRDILKALDEGCSHGFRTVRLSPAP
ncbi:hypothetical protein BKA61DRAFT_693658 [Leptodontidium sp. MPI-SDFR-AT-0119]|nr:hypothetical protein BKA61DRAFT_693658 [Leptodontidium sp. MPI-SDFR-AT-0119]